MSGCTEESHDIVLPPEGGGGEEEAKSTCLGCHGSEEMLKAALGSESGAKVLVGNKGDG
jgi:mono/diheme cytochrome c family protein